MKAASRPRAVAKSSIKSTSVNSDRGTNEGSDRGDFAAPSRQRASDRSERRSDKVVNLCALAKPIRQRSPRDALAGDGRDKRKKK